MRTTVPQFSPPNAQWVDVQTGQLTFAAATFLRQMWERMGGAVAPSITDLMDSQIANLQAVALQPEPDLFSATYQAQTAAGSSTQVQVNSGGSFAAFSTFTYDGGTNTLTFGNATGSALSMTIKPQAPTVLQDAGTLALVGQAAVKANSNGGNVTRTAGVATGSGTGGSITDTTGDGGQVGGDVTLLCGTGSVSGGGVSVSSGLSGGDGGAALTMTGGVSGVGGGGFSMSSGSGTVGGDFSFIAGGGATADGNMFFQAPDATNFIWLRTASAGGAKQIGIFDAAPVSQPTTAVAAATFVANAGTAVNDASTFDGYTIKKVVKALRLLGILA